MKKMKKIFALLIAMVMVLGMSTSVFAAELTITGAYDGETYTYYKLLDYSVDADGNYRYSTTSKDQADALTEALGFTFSKDGDDYVLNNAGNFEDDAESIVTALNDLDSIPNIETGSGVAKDGIASWSSLTEGFYFVTTTTGAICTLQNGTGSTIIVEKHDPSGVEKEITSGAEDGTANVGDYIQFSVTITAKPGETLTLTDELSEGLTLIAADDATHGRTVTSGGAAYAAFTEKAWTTTKDASAINLEFTEVTADTTIVVTYWAQINDSALELDEVNNIANLTWGNNQKATPDGVTVDIDLFKFEIDKVDGSDQSALEGVKFTLVNADDEYYDGTTVWTSSETELTTNSEGKIVIAGIAAGTYTLTETETIEGYNKLESPITIVVGTDGSFTVTGADGDGTATQTGNAIVTIENNSGAVLPSTGGIGTTIFYIIGAILVIGAGVVLVTRRRMNVQ